MDIRVKYALCVEHDANWYEVKAKSEYAFWIVQRGSLEIASQHRVYRLAPGDVFLFYPEILYHASSGEGCAFTFIHFDAVVGNNYQALQTYALSGMYEGSVAARYTAVLLDCAAAMQQDALFAQMEIEGAVSYTLARMMRRYYHRAVRQDLQNPHKSALAQLQPVLIYISHHLGEPIYVEQLAAEIGLSPKYFIRLFKRTMGLTPMSYVTEVKMKKALQYLYERRYSVKEVAALVGYADIYTFSKAFKKMYGIAPSRL